MRFGNRAPRAWLVCVAIIAACSTPEERVESHLSAADEFLEEDRPEQAILAYRSALRIDPANAEVNERLGHLLRETGSDGAARHLRDAFELDKTRVDAGLAAARLLMVIDRDSAHALVEEVTRLSPNDPAVYTARSDLALLNNDSRRALIAANRAVRLDPDSWEARFQLGKVYRARIRAMILNDREPREFDLRSAIEAFERAEEIAGENALIRLELARVYGSWEKHSEAQMAYRDALDVAVAVDDRRAKLAIALSAVDYSKSTKSYSFLGWALREVVTLAPDHIGAWSRLAALEDTLGGDGRKIVEELIAKRPTDVHAQLLYTKYLISHTAAEAAMEHLRKLIAGEQDEPIYWEQIARIQIHRGKLENAGKTLEQLSNRHPGSPVAQRVAIRLALAEERYDDAVDALDALMLEHPDAEHHRLLAVAEFRRGNLAEAATAIDRASPVTGDAAPDVAKLRAQIHYAARDWPNALKSFRELHARRIDLSPSERVQFAATLYESRRPDEGRKALRKLLKRERIPAKAAIEYAKREGARDSDGAYAFLETARKQNPAEPEVLGALTEMDLANGRSAQALARLRHVIDTGRAAAAVVLLHADVLARVGKLEQAEAHALRAFEADPTLAGASDLLFELYRRQGELDSARESFAEADAAGVLHPGAVGLLGRLYEHAGQVDAAREAYERSLAALPDAATVGARLAFLLALQDQDLDRALALAEAARPLATERAHVADAVGYVYFKKGRESEAVRLFENAIVLAEAERIQIPGYHYHLGIALRALERNEEAASAFARALELDDSFDDADDARQQLEATRHGKATASNPS